MLLKRLQSLLSLVEREGSDLDLQILLTVFSNVLANTTLHLLDQDAQVIASSGQHRDPYGELSDELRLEYDFLDNAKDEHTRILPIIGSGTQVGTLMVIKEGPYTPEDDVVLECGLTIFGLLISERQQGVANDIAHLEKMATSALASLTYSELVITKQVIGELQRDSHSLNQLPEGLIIASKIADSNGMARSVIVNAIRKMQSAGVIEARSLGMKGTWIKVVNSPFLNAIKDHALQPAQLSEN